MSLEWISSLKQASVPDIHVVLGEKFLDHTTLPGAVFHLFLGVSASPVPTFTYYPLQIFWIRHRHPKLHPSPKSQGKVTSTMGPPQITLSTSALSEPID